MNVISSDQLCRFSSMLGIDGAPYSDALYICVTS